MRTVVYVALCLLVVYLKPLFCVHRFDSMFINRILLHVSHRCQESPDLLQHHSDFVGEVTCRKGYSHLLPPPGPPPKWETQISWIIPPERQPQPTGRWIFFISGTNLLHSMLIIDVEL